MIPLPTTHEGICKFVPGDPNYYVVAQQIVDVVDVSVEKLREQAQKDRSLAERFENLAEPSM